MVRREARHVTVEFRRGPLDGFSSGLMTDENVRLPEYLVSRWGRYTLTFIRSGHYAYDWHEGESAP